MKVEVRKFNGVEETILTICRNQVILDSDASTMYCAEIARINEIKIGKDGKRIDLSMLSTL